MQHSSIYALFIRALPFIFTILFSACSQEVKKTEYTHTIPADATEVSAINLNALAEKAGFKEGANSNLIQELTNLFLKSSSPTLSQEIEKLITHTKESGIDWNAPVYVFKSPTLNTTACVIKVVDLVKLEALIQMLAKENICTLPEKRDQYQSCEIKNANISLAYNDGTILMVYGTTHDQLTKLTPAITRLMGQSADKSIHSVPHFKQMMEQTGDIRVLATPDALPIDIRGVLNWPHGTRLTGYLLFENGRIYAMLQRAGFQGKTQESNQPFHPRNSHELQQAMMSMMHGQPFNIELSSDELLTLTNLRVLMEFSPNDSTIRSLYQLIQMVEVLNLRGDNNRTTFTVVLSEKNQNALKTLVDFAKQFIGL